MSEYKATSVTIVLTDTVDNGVNKCAASIKFFPEPTDADEVLNSDQPSVITAINIMSHLLHIPGSSVEQIDVNDAPFSGLRSLK